MICKNVFMFFFVFMFSLYSFGGKKDDCSSLAKLGRGHLTLLDLISLRDLATRNNRDYKNAFDKYGVGNLSKTFKLRNEKAKVKGELGSGFRAVVYELSGNRALKVPRSSGDLFAIEIESLVISDLKAHFSKYGIETVEILSSGEKGAYLEKPLLEKEQMADWIVSHGGLSKKQSTKLNELWEKAKQYARETGIGLDLKASNLWWNGKNWVLVDGGIRTSYRPYGFTLDVPNFQEYLRTFSEEEPGFDRTTITEMLEKLEEKP